jgi:hypothetical protein
MANKLFTGSLKPIPTQPVKTLEAAAPVVASDQERVTLPLTPEQKDLLDALTRKLQRQRLSKSFTVTRNDILRGLVDCLSLTIFDELHLRDKAELSSFIRRKLLS